MRQSCKEQAPISISLNFDSLNEAYGFPQGYRDPSFFVAFDRLVNLASKHGLTFTVYIIGEDLENPEHFARVRDWAAAGYEIGNHSWNHYFNLGALTPHQIREEVRRAHDRIAECIKREPRGFIAPAWAVSRHLIEVLIDLRYAYDSSVFPSVLLYPMLARIALNHVGRPRKAMRILDRKDWLVPFTKPLRPFFVDRYFRNSPVGGPGSLLILPMPTLSRFGPALWHSVGFTFGWKTVCSQIQKLLQRHDGFYYLIHPADFLAPGELQSTFKHCLPRMNVPLADKMAALDEVFGLMAASSRPKVTMAELARYHGANA
jgi:hypothetical protein